MMAEKLDLNSLSDNEIRTHNHLVHKGTLKTHELCSVVSKAEKIDVFKETTSGDLSKKINQIIDEK